MSAYIDTPEHRAGMYASAFVPEMRDWARRDFLDWINRRDAKIRADTTGETTWP